MCVVPVAAYGVTVHTETGWPTMCSVACMHRNMCQAIFTNSILIIFGGKRPYKAIVFVPCNLSNQVKLNIVAQIEMLPNPCQLQNVNNLNVVLNIQ